MSSSTRKATFTPWIGPHYLEEGLGGTNLLVVGESHYGEEENLRSGFTRDVVRSKVYEGRKAFFTFIAKLIVGRGTGNHIPQWEREWVWDRIAFYNYIQSMAGTNADGKVTDQMWKEAREPFLDVVEVTHPDAILVLGQTLSSHLPDKIGYSESDEVETVVIDHPSRGFRCDSWIEEVRELVGEVDPSSVEGKESA